MIKIYTTLDCVGELTKFEKMLLVIIKGALYDFYHSRSEPYAGQPATYHIIVSPSYGNEKAMTTFLVDADTTTPKGLFDEVKRLITPFSCGFQLQGGFREHDNKTSMILQRFEMKRETLNYFVAEGVTRK